MGQSLAQNYLHIVFSTKHRKPWIRKPFTESLNKYLAVVCKDKDSPSLAVGSHLDHVHILCRLSPKIALSDFVQKIKSNSSRWMKTLDSSLTDFSWQDGYAAFSISTRAVESVREYILNQEEHHGHQDYRVEILSLLKEHDVEYDERYFWD
jgi:REP element-mobilizing transposase RayT